MSSIKLPMNWGSSCALSTISRQRAIFLLISSLLCPSPIVAFGVSHEIDQTDPNIIKIRVFYYDKNIPSEDLSISSILEKEHIDRNGRKVVFDLGHTYFEVPRLRISDTDHPFLEGFDSSLGDEVIFGDELRLSGTLIQAEGSSWGKNENQVLELGTVTFANVKNDFKGTIKANTMYIGNGGNAKDTELGGFRLVSEPKYDHDWPGYLVINFNNESEYELMESSKGGQLNSGDYYPSGDAYWIDDWEKFETRPGLHIIGTGVTRVTAQHHFKGPTIVHNGTLQFEDNGHIYDPPYYTGYAEWNRQNPSIYTGKENVGTVSYKISEGQEYQPEVSVYGYGDVKKQGKGQVTFDNSDVKMTSLEPHWIKLYFTNEMADWLDDYDPVSHFDPRFYPGSRIPITDESWASKAEKVYELWAEYKTPGQHNYYGKTLIEGGTLLLEKKQYSRQYG